MTFRHVLRDTAESEEELSPIPLEAQLDIASAAASSVRAKRRQLNIGAFSEMELATDAALEDRLVRLGELATSSSTAAADTFPWFAGENGPRRLLLLLKEGNVSIDMLQKYEREKNFQGLPELNLA
ncbi:hypothetical protein HDU90_008931 [Geranomyces variabilis]|nr:hypothetical protein HDU90_008931 [Geranomyces variabilis]